MKTVPPVEPMYWALSWRMLVRWSCAQVGLTSEMPHFLDAVRRTGSNGIEISADLTEPDAVAMMASQIRNELGPVDILVNNAGAFPRIAWADADEEVWAKALDINLTSHYRTCRAFTPGLHPGHDRARLGADHQRLIRQRPPRACRTVRLQHGQGRSPRPHPVAGQGTWPARHHREHCPSGGNPGPRRERPPRSRPRQARRPDRPLLRVPRRGQPEDVAAAITFLANPNGSFVTAQSLTIDGGWLPH
ncbi:SDR family NAD(P)-dependent oxidoreductase [Streptomyces goshikiensis]